MKKIVSALLISAAAISAPAFAEGFTDGQVGSAYAVVDLGVINYGGGGSATAISVGGGVQVHPAVAVEVDYMHGGTANYGFNVWQESLSALQVWGVGHYTINDQFQAYAKGGVALNSYKWGFVAGPTTTNSSTDLAAAIGIKYNISSAVAVHAQYMDAGTASANVLSVGAQFNF